MASRLLLRPTMPRRIPIERGRDLLAQPEQSLGYLLKQVHHLMRQGIEQQMRTVRLENMTHAHAVTLHSLTSQPGASGADLARGAMVTPQTMNAILVNLETQGLIERRPDPSHGRILATYITDKGRRHLERGVSAAERFLDDMESALTASERRELRRLLQKCLGRLGSLTGTDNPTRASPRIVRLHARSATATAQTAE